MKISASNVVKNFRAILLLGILVISCRKDPIFDFISTETAPIPPRIEGSPTNMVVFERKYLTDPTDPGSEVEINLLFVASGRLHWYGGPNPKKPDWDRDYGIPQPEGKIISLAVTRDRLYALCLIGSNLNTKLRYTTQTPNDTWHEVTGVSDYPLIQSIYSAYSDDDIASSQLFAGACSGENYALLYVDEASDTLERLKPDTKMLSGAAYRNNTYYLCTRGDGIFKVDNTLANVSQLENIHNSERREKRLHFMGMIRLKDKSIIAIEREGGALYEIRTDIDDFSQMFQTKNGQPIDSIITGSYAMGALALWETPHDPNDPNIPSVNINKVLVAGRQGTLYSTSYNNGYIEFCLIKSNDSKDGSLNKEKPRDSTTMFTTDNSSQYSTSLEKHPINHLFQAPFKVDEEMTFFASTQTGGLWSCRKRSGNTKEEWNAED